MRVHLNVVFWENECESECSHQKEKVSADFKALTTCDELRGIQFQDGHILVRYSSLCPQLRFWSRHGAVMNRCIQMCGLTVSLP
jgi:hypothetical protein